MIHDVVYHPHSGLCVLEGTYPFQLRQAHAVLRLPFHQVVRGRRGWISRRCASNDGK